MTGVFSLISAIKRASLVVLLFLLLAVLILLSASMGYIEIGFFDILKIIVSQFPGISVGLDHMNETWPTIVMDVRLPRILTCT
ncbi:MAG: hypothetical protein HQK61_12305, partial [Desulfamplus sp.]|nr:hypothetical protein [Desulfamplus sp.]